jgi:hypothetical protein
MGEGLSGLRKLDTQKSGGGTMNFASRARSGCLEGAAKGKEAQSWGLAQVKRGPSGHQRIWAPS